MAVAPAVHDQRGEQSEDAARGADRGRAGREVRDQEARRAGEAEDDERARRTVDLDHGGPEVPDPHQVEEDVEQAAVEVDGGEDRPPPALVPRHSARHAELVERAHPGREEREHAAHLEDRLGLEHECGDVEHDAGGADERDQVDPVAEQALELGRPAVESRSPRAAERAAWLAHADELPALRADHRTLRPAQHGA